MHPNQIQDIYPDAAQITDTNAIPVVSVGALLARLERVDQWNDLADLKDVLRALVGAEPLNDAERMIRPEFRPHYGGPAGLLATWEDAVEREFAETDEGTERHRALAAERRVLRRAKVGRKWAELRIAYDPSRHTANLQGRITGDTYPEAWTTISLFHDAWDQRDQYIESLLRDAELDGYDPATVKISARVVASDRGEAR